MTKVLKLAACILGVFFSYSSLHYFMQGDVVMFIAILPLTATFIWWYNKRILNG
tara:strand:- start:38 stop:199 length:162 start_codon:yes stop_codon:yes gene_type:complete